MPPNQVYSLFAAFSQSVADAISGSASAPQLAATIRPAVGALMEFFNDSSRFCHRGQELLVQLHNLMFALVELGLRDLADEISSVCELYWQQSTRPNRELIVPQTIVMALLYALESTEARRAASVCDMLSVLDLSDDSAASVRALILRCALCKPLVRSTDGRRLLAHCFAVVDSEFLSELQDAVKLQLPEISTLAVDDEVLAGFADIYVRAWRAAAPGEAQSAIERVCLQDLCSVAINCANPTIVRAALGLLRHVHNDRHRHMVDGALLRAYEPLLFRALVAANTQTRVNAAALLADAFPLQDPAAAQAETDATLQSQLDALDALLSDPAPAVRVCAVRGAGRWLSVYWEMLPREVHLALLRRLLKLSHDCNAPVVRAAVCDAFAFVLTQHLALPLIGQALPKLEHLLDDRAALVRNAFLSLMLEVKKVKAIKFYHTAAPDRLLARLALDDAARANATVCELLQPTFFAEAKPARQQAERALFLLHTQPDVAPKFFAGACTVTGSGAAARLIGYLTRRLVRALEHGPVPAEALGDDLQHVFINDYTTVAALLRALNAMWLAIRPADGAQKKPQRAKKAQSDEIVALLHSLWTDDLLCQLWLFYASRAEAGAAMLFEPLAQLAARLPRAHVPNFHASALSALGISASSSDLPGNADACGVLMQVRTAPQLRAFARCMAAWGAAAHVVGAQFAHIAKFLGEDGVAEDEDNNSDFGVEQPLQLLSFALADDMLRDAALQHERGAQLLFTLLRRLWRSSLVESDLLALASAVCARHALHSDTTRASTSSDSVVPRLAEVLYWFANRALRRSGSTPLTEAQVRAITQLMCVASEASALGVGVGAQSDNENGDEETADNALSLSSTPHASASFAAEVLERVCGSQARVADTIQCSADARVCMMAAVKAAFGWMAMDAPQSARRIHDAALLHRQPGQWNDLKVPELLIALSSKPASEANDLELDYHVQALIDTLSTPSSGGEDAGLLADRVAEALVPRGARARERAQRVWKCIARAVRERLIDSEGRLPWRAMSKARLLDFCTLVSLHKNLKENAEAKEDAAGVRASVGAFRDWIQRQPVRGSGDDDASSGDDNGWRAAEDHAMHNLRLRVV